MKDSLPSRFTIPSRARSAQSLARNRTYSLPQDLVHGLASGQFIHQLVQIADLLHELTFDILHPITADHPGDLEYVRVDAWRLGEESLEVDFVLDLLLERLFIVAR